MKKLNADTVVAARSTTSLVCYLFLIGPILGANQWGLVMTKALVLNYRRGDRSGSAGRIYDMLSQRLSGTRIFMDVDSVEPGVDFKRALDEQLAGCDYFIAVVGPNWTNAKTTDGRRR